MQFAMSRRKQSNPKSLKSEFDETSEDTQKDSSDQNMANEQEMKYDESDDENTEECIDETDQSEHGDCVTSSTQQVVATRPDQSNSEEKVATASVTPESPLSTIERDIPSMATSDKGRSPPAISFADLPKVLASNSYLAAALKASVGSFNSLTFTHSDSTPKQGAFSPPDSPLSIKGGSKQLSSLINSPSLSDIANSANAIASSLLSAEATQNHLNTMIQGIPLLSSVLPALQRLAPGALSALSSGSGGIVCVCGVKFNSTSNLEAHRLFYCSHRQVNPEGRSDRKEGSPSRETEEDSASPSGSKVLKCPHCAYTTSHKLSLNGHMNIHTNPEETSSQSSKSSSFSAVVDPRAQERYCSDCDIQFSSLKTYRVHKAHYCQTRHVLKGSKSPAREDSTHSALSALGQSGSSGGQPILALNTNPVLLLPYSMVAGAQLLPPHILPQLGAAFVLPNGQVHPIPSATGQHSNNSGGSSLPPLLSPGAVAAATAAIISASTNAGSSTLSFSLAKGDSSSSSSSSSSSLRSKSPREEESSAKRRGDGESPLDLTTTKKPKLAIKTDLLNDEEKENRETLNSFDQKSPVFGGGEFEGKLLLSSPSRVSPCTDEEEIHIKSPRPASAAPSLSSPRGLPESPKPSTSAISTSSRSPGHSSPGASTGTQNIPPPLPPGFPSHLLSSLDSLSSSLPLASLQCLQSLQNVPRELALKLINPDLLMNGLPPVLNPPPVIVKQGEAKCNECNIVFYKEESLQIHKKHYCSARDTTKATEEEQARSPPSTSDTVPTPLRSPVRDPVANALSTAKESVKSAKPLLQFICTACGIKFSSPDNLAAHQTYYCPKREGAAEEGVAKGVWRCPRCRIVMAETMQAAHQCVTPTPAPSHGWKCPCCPVLSPTAAAAQKHLETHAGIKAFRCTICGYRGNTLRGMRTHIRMHFEKRTNDLQEENFIACILEDDDQRTRNMNSETRKLIDSTRMILENTALSALLGDGSTLSEQVDPPLSCAYCPFITPVRTSLLQHLTIVHKIGLENSLSQEIKNLFEAKMESEANNASSGTISPGNSTPSTSNKKENNRKETENGSGRETPPALHPIKLEPEVKLEIQEPDEEISRSLPEEEPKSPSSDIIPNGSSPNGQCYCHTCNISFSLLDSYVAHKRFYCTRPESRTPPETTVQ